ncbi:MAG: zinc-binding dehydrogenase [Planctomycetes bacterium]|nr:zinc-binding dehydrogenase [Planctomycetota bacterium]
MSKSIVFTGKNECAVIEKDRVELSPDSVRIRTTNSLMSTGTETIVLGRKFAPGTHWDNWVKYPFFPGYAIIGEVVECGAEVMELKKGVRVAARAGHGSEHVAPEAECYAVPESLDPMQAVWFALSKISFMGVKAGKVGLGSRVLVIGGGPIGQMALRLCVAAGAEKVVLVDMLKERLDLARAGGATSVIGKPLDQALEELEFACGGKPQIVIDSTGNAKVFETALKSAADRGTVVVLGDTGVPGEQHLTSDVITRGLHIVGAHDGHCDAEWTEARIVNLFFSLLERGRINMDGMNTHVFSPDQAIEAYDLAETKRAETMGVVFDWQRG